jgi:hypothetical protein
MITIGLELGSVSGKLFQLPPQYVSAPNAFEAREELWDEIDKYADDKLIDGLFIHRLYGEPHPSDNQDYRARWEIENSGDPQLTDYAKHMTRRAVKFAMSHPEVRIDWYMGKLNHWRMRRLLDEQGGDVWRDAVVFELSIPLMLISMGCDVRLIFDASAGFNEYESNGFPGLETQYITQLNRQHLGRVVVEATPRPDHPLAGLPSLCVENRYRYLRDNKPEWIDASPGITRYYSHVSDFDPVAFIRECREQNQIAIIPLHGLKARNMSVAQVVRELDIAGDPQGVE